MSNKPLNQKAYGSIPHLPGSRMGPAERHINPSQAKILIEKKRDKYDIVICQEKLDGSNVAIAKIDNCILPLTRRGYIANTSPFEMLHIFYDWVVDQENQTRFSELLNNNERLCGEWLLQAHGTRYNLPHEPFVVFDIMTNMKRTSFDELTKRVQKYDFIQPQLISIGDSISIKDAMNKVKTSGHGAIDEVEGCVWRVERKQQFDFMAKYVRPDKVDGLYLKMEPPIYNEYSKGKLCSINFRTILFDSKTKQKI